MFKKASSVVLIRDGKNAPEILLLRRRKSDSFLSEACVFPGGLVEENESPFEAAVRELHEEANIQLSHTALHYYAQWQTPSIERRRFDATFFVAQCPPNQVATPDNEEVVESLWVTSEFALANSNFLKLLPPQLQTFYEFSKFSAVQQIIAAAAKRQQTKTILLPRLLVSSPPTLVLPWDPAYSSGQGDEHPIHPEHPWAIGPGRFVKENGWQIRPGQSPE